MVETIRTTEMIEAIGVIEAIEAVLPGGRRIPRRKRCP